MTDEHAELRAGSRKLFEARGMYCTCTPVVRIDRTDLPQNRAERRAYRRRWGQDACEGTPYVHHFPDCSCHVSDEQVVEHKAMMDAWLARNG